MKETEFRISSSSMVRRVDTTRIIPVRIVKLAAVRPEYAVLAREFRELAAQFGHRIDDVLQQDIARLASAIECVDRHIDDVSSTEVRVALWRSVIDLLAHDGAPRADLDPELASATLDLRELALRRRVLPRILRIVKKEMTTSETMRGTSQLGIYLAAVQREGRLTTALALVVAGDACGAAFRRFFFRLGGPANLIDKLKDARADHARGEILLVPGLLLHARLALSALVRLPALFASHPQWLRVVRLGIRYLGPLTAHPRTAR
jgi:hypothetical protein